MLCSEDLGISPPTAMFPTGLECKGFPNCYPVQGFVHHGTQLLSFHRGLGPCGAKMAVFTGGLVRTVPKLLCFKGVWSRTCDPDLCIFQRFWSSWNQNYCVFPGMFVLMLPEFQNFPGLWSSWNQSYCIFKGFWCTEAKTEAAQLEPPDLRSAATRPERTYVRNF